MTPILFVEREEELKGNKSKKFKSKFILFFSNATFIPKEHTDVIKSKLNGSYVFKDSGNTSIICEIW